PDAVWRVPWILHVTAWGNGEKAVLEYLARYVFRIALTNARIVGLDDETVTIQYKERKTGRLRTCRLSGEEFSPFDRADMNEHIGAAGVGLNEPEAFRRIEPFDCARRHGVLLSICPTSLAEPTFIARRRHRRSALALLSRGGRPAHITQLRNSDIAPGPCHGRPASIAGNACNEHNRTRREDR